MWEYITYVGLETKIILEEEVVKQDISSFPLSGIEKNVLCNLGDYYINLKYKFDAV